MKASLTDKLLQIQDRFEELGALLSDSEVIAQQEKFGLSPRNMPN